MSNFAATFDRILASRSYGLYDPSFEHDSCGIGFIAHIKGVASHKIVADAGLALSNMEHRAAVGSEQNTGDGAGILVAMPHNFFTRVALDELKCNLPDLGQYAVGIVFLPETEEKRTQCKNILQKIITEQNQLCLGWRTVPTEPGIAQIGKSARDSQPIIEQVFIAANSNIDQSEFERQLFVIRKRASHALRSDKNNSFYICSLSSRLIVYKGMLMSSQVVPFFPDLSSPDFESHLAIIHARFSTNTSPSWDRAQPLRYMSHNGEINTLRGNINYMTARQGVMESDVFSKTHLQSLFPVIEPDCSDSGNFDNALEMLIMNGRSLPEAIMMMIPEAWRDHHAMQESVRQFYEYHACLQEPWDGPASIVFTDGSCLGAVLDRNGLRPSRYYITNDDIVIMASEVGVIPVPSSQIKRKGRLQPGRLFVVDFEQGRLVPDDELKKNIAARRPYSTWLSNQKLDLKQLQTTSAPPAIPQEDFLKLLKSFGYTLETFKFMLLPLVSERRDPVGSMGNDSALACLSDQPRLVYDYFKQLFAQVTNPPIDSIREEVIMSLECYIGPEQSLLKTTDAHCKRLFVRHPIIRDERMVALKEMHYRGWRTKVIDCTYEKSLPDGELVNLPSVNLTCPYPAYSGLGLKQALDRICSEAESAIDDGYSLIILSDRATSASRVAVSALLSCGAVHHHLITKQKRTRIGIIVETGEAREVHHHCLLVGYGADAINPYLAFESLKQARSQGLLDDIFSSNQAVVDAYRVGVAKGMLKVMARMGISTLHSYKGAQIFEALGLGDEIIKKCFIGTPSRLKGVTFAILETESMRRHELGFSSNLLSREIPTHSVIPNNAISSELHNTGEFHWRPEEEKKGWNPLTISALQRASRSNSFDDYRAFSNLANSDSLRQCTIRGLLTFREPTPIPIEEVEPADSIVRRFCTGAMSFGSISAEAHETIAIAMNRLGGKSNTGEGGEDPERFSPLPNGDSRRSAIKQIASGRFGVTAWYLANADELQIKMAQGAKPGEGGELPGKKVNEIIARTRYSTSGVGLISPPPHHDIYSIEDLKQLIHDLKNSNPLARISVKLVSEVGVGTIAAGVAKAHAEHILISGDVGGTGASPLTSIKHAGLPWELGIAETHLTLTLNDLRSRVVLQTDGGLKTGRDVVIACCLGAEEFGFATAPLITLGCVMMRKCHQNTCPVGIATQDPALRRRFAGRPEYIINYLMMVAQDVRLIMSQLGFRTINEMVGRVDSLVPDKAIHHWKSDGLDISPLLVPAINNNGSTAYCSKAQNHKLEEALDNELIRLSEPAITNAQPVSLEFPISNTQRTVGTMLSYRIVKRWGEKGLPQNSIKIHFNGSAGQSFGAFLCPGITLELEGDANDYVGKGLSGGKLVIFPQSDVTFQPESNVIIGNVALYGATSGYAFIRGRAAERFCVRNSGAHAVVEGVGDHGCEYMTGGRVVVLGKTGRNFAAGMSGGIAYIWDPDNKFRARCNTATVDLEPLEDEQDVFEVYSLVTNHEQCTGSSVAAHILSSWNSHAQSFVKVMPLDYKRVLLERASHDEEVEAIGHGVTSDG